MVSMAIRAARSGAMLVALLGLVAVVQAQQAPSAAQLKLAQQVVEMQGSQRSFEGAVPTIFTQIYNQYVSQNPDLDKDISATLRALLPEFDKRKEEITGILARIYAEKFTEAELKDIVAFYESPTGKKFVGATGDFGKQTMGRLQEWSGKVNQDAIDRLKAEMKKKGHNI
jgi:hypothetical protein